MRRGDSRFTITIFGIAILLAAMVALTDGNAQEARIGFVLGGGMIVLNEWWQWRRRQ